MTFCQRRIGLYCDGLNARLHEFEFRGYRDK